VLRSPTSSRSRSQKFYGLNPDIGSNCGSLWLDYYVGVAN
jgi:hypothetical protein